MMKGDGDDAECARVFFVLEYSKCMTAGCVQNPSKHLPQNGTSKNYYDN
jgi:hypothetical protein